jgi:hypothetical protein
LQEQLLTLQPFFSFPKIALKNYCASTALLRLFSPRCAYLATHLDRLMSSQLLNQLQILAAHCQPRTKGVPVVVPAVMLNLGLAQRGQKPDSRTFDGKHQNIFVSLFAALFQFAHRRRLVLVAPMLPKRARNASAIVCR